MNVGSREEQIVRDAAESAAWAMAAAISLIYQQAGVGQFVDREAMHRNFVDNLTPFFRNSLADALKIRAAVDSAEPKVN